MAGLGAVLARWEKLYFHPFPSVKELKALSNVVMVDVEDLREMLPNKGMVTQPKPIMLCAACYGENPYHRMVWQDKHKRGCQVHGLELLSRCINCKKLFLIPSKWEGGKCQRCGLPFVKMAKHQKPIPLTQKLV